MKPTWINYICAHMFKVVIFGGASIFCLVILTHHCLGLETLKTPDVLWIFFLMFVIAFALGCVLSSVVLISFAPVIFKIFAKINGAPFSEGDYVHVLVGKYKGSSGPVSGIDDWRKKVSVDLVNSSGQDIVKYYPFNQILKVKSKSAGAEKKSPKDLNNGSSGCSETEPGVRRNQ